MQPWLYLRVSGEKVSVHEAGKEVNHGVRLQYGEFHSVGQKMAELTGAERFNLKLIYNYEEEKHRMETYGVSSEDCSKLYIMSLLNLGKTSNYICKLLVAFFLLSKFFYFYAFPCRA